MAVWIGYKGHTHNISEHGVTLEPMDPEFFWSQKKPSRKEYGKKYVMVTGPFKNKAEAKLAYERGQR